MSGLVMIKFKRGATFDFSGQVKDKGVPFPLTNCTILADLRSKNGFAKVQALHVTILDAATGKVRLFAPPAETAQWKPIVHELDIRLVDGGGNVLLSNTLAIDVLERVTQ